MSRAEAKAAGLKRYFTGKPCPKGHVAERYVNGTCYECIKITNSTSRQWKIPTKVVCSDLKIISRTEAKALGLKRYFTGKPCKHGHIDERNTNSKVCIICCRVYSNLNSLKPGKRVKKAVYNAKPENRDKRSAGLRLKIQAARAAKLLTETLGIPHHVVKMEDGTFQPVPVST